MIKIIIFTHLITYVGLFFYAQDLNKLKHNDFFEHINTHTTINELYEMDLIDY